MASTTAEYGEAPWKIKTQHDGIVINVHQVGDREHNIHVLYVCRK